VVGVLRHFKDRPEYADTYFQKAAEIRAA
jgi:hypothetical protein